MTKKLIVLAVAAGLLTSACGPTVPLNVGLKEQPVDLLYGAQSKPGTPPRPYSLDTMPGFPAVIIPPPPLFPSGRGGPGIDPPPPPVVGPCPAPDIFASPEVVATPRVAQLPAEGTYSFRREGYVKTGPSADLSGVPTTPLSQAVERKVQNAATLSNEVRRYEVAQVEGGSETVTTYDVDNGMTTEAGHQPGGLHIVQVVTSNGQTVEAFAPTTGVRIMVLPAKVEAPDNTIDDDQIDSDLGDRPDLTGQEDEGLDEDVVSGEEDDGVPHRPRVPDDFFAPVNTDRPEQVSAGIDPLTQTTMRVKAWTTGKRKVKLCGDVMDAWQVRITASVTSPTKSYTIDGFFAVATQFGGLIVEENLFLSGRDGDSFIEMESSTVLNHIKPRSK